uniref:AlNc14C457G11775 protein n=1 Tax=Albugo laibachii Nc14 TaxID=890382 RepID=F0X036_9STRA|nr:AlNc14C457G11775 [Albugo laibachii Nc14]|eukprot:CCA27118.1 AlNc14C457G11775 [Albugo laibachii Nc14]
MTIIRNLSLEKSHNRMSRFDRSSSIRILLRALQFLFSLVAISTMAASFRSIEFGMNVYSSSLGSSVSTYVTVLTYSSLIYSSWYLFGVEILKHYTVPKLQDWLIDGTFAFLYSIASILLVTSPYARHCSLFELLLRCGNLKATVVFLFLNLCALLGSIAMSFVPIPSAVEPKVQIPHPEERVPPYASNNTPKCDASANVL